MLCATTVPLVSGRASRDAVGATALRDGLREARAARPSTYPTNTPSPRLIVISLVAPTNTKKATSAASARP